MKKNGRNNNNTNRNNGFSNNAERIKEEQFKDELREDHIRGEEPELCGDSYEDFKPYMGGKDFEEFTTQPF